MEPVILRLEELISKQSSKKSQWLPEELVDILSNMKDALEHSSKEQLAPHHSRLEKLLLDRLLARSGAHVITRQLTALCVTKFYELNSSTLRQAYQAILSCFSTAPLPTASSSSSSILSSSALASLSSSSSASSASASAAAFSAASISATMAASLLALECFAHLVRRFGHQFVMQMNEAIAFIHRALKSGEWLERELALNAVTALYVGTGGPMRHETASGEMWKQVGRYASDKSAPVRQAASRCLLVMLENSEDARELDVVMPIMLKALTDVDDTGRYEAARSLGHMLAFCASLDHAKIAAAARNKKPKKRLYDITNTHEALLFLRTQFTKASSAVLRASLTQATLSLLQSPLSFSLSASSSSSSSSASSSASPSSTPSSSSALDSTSSSSASASSSSASSSASAASSASSSSPQLAYLALVYTFLEKGTNVQK